MFKDRHLALLAAFIATSIYGINHTVGKELMPFYIEPFGLVQLRVIGAAGLFWLISLIGPSEKIDIKDFKHLGLCVLFGMTFNMLAYFKGLSYSTPINSSIIITFAPILLFIMSALFIKEHISIRKYIGIAFGFSGALMLVFFNDKVSINAENIPLGNLLLILNCILYGSYLILIKPLTKKYHTITLMKWLFLIAILTNLPFTIGEFMEVEWQALPFSAIWRMTFVVVGTTFLTYLLNVYALRELKASTIGVFMYLQPIIGILYAVLVGADSLDVNKTIAAIMIFVGVYIVSKQPAINKST